MFLMQALPAAIFLVALVPDPGEPALPRFERPHEKASGVLTSLFGATSRARSWTRSARRSARTTGRA